MADSEQMKARSGQTRMGSTPTQVPSATKSVAPAGIIGGWPCLSSTTSTSNRLFTGILARACAKARPHVLNDWHAWVREPRRQMLLPPDEEPRWICRVKLTREVDRDFYSLELAFFVDIESESSLGSLISPFLNHIDCIRGHEWS